MRELCDWLEPMDFSWLTDALLPSNWLEVTAAATEDGISQSFLVGWVATGSAEDGGGVEVVLVDSLFSASSA